MSGQTPSIDEQLTDIERRLDRIQANAELLIALRIERDHPGLTLVEALAIARDPDELRAFYSELPDG